MNTILFNENGRLRSGWRAGIFLVTFLFLSIIFIFGSMGLLSMLPFGPSAGSYLPLVIPFAVSSAIAIILGGLYGKLFEGLPLRALGISFRGNWLSNFAFGCMVGSVAFVTAIIIAVMAGGMNLSVNRDSGTSAIFTTLLTTLVIFFVGALSEETLFRGYFLQTLLRSNQLVLGVGMTSLLFALAHDNNPAIGKLSLLNTFLAGCWFAAGYLKTRELWFPLGMHLMWNWLQGPVLGINVSGIAEFSPDPVLRLTDAGPAWLTGGSYGIEGGVVCTFALVLSMVMIYFMPRPKADDEMLIMSNTESNKL